MWDAQVEALAARHTVVTWDLRGHGRSAPYPGPYTRAAPGRQLLGDLHARVGGKPREGGAGVAAVRVAERAHPCVGHSVGGYLSLAHALLHPDTVAALAVLSAGPGFRNRERRAAYNRSVETVAERCGFSREVAEVAVQHDSLVIDGLGGITCPTAVIVGADDWHVYVAGSRHLAANLPDARLVEVTGAGHDVHRERPEAVAAVLAELADRVWS